MSYCERCFRMCFTVRRSKLSVIGLKPRKCGCLFLCKSCRNELVEALQK